MTTRPTNRNPPSTHRSRPTQDSAAPNAAALHWYNQGLLLHQQGRLDEAEQAYRQALTINRRFAEAMNNLGNVLKDQGRWQAAIDAYKRALKVYPKHPMLLNNLGYALSNVGQDLLAASYLKQAIQADPHYAEAFVNLGNALRYQDAGQASACYRKALRLNPQLPEAHNNLGALLEEQGRFEEAAAALREALRLRPSFGEAHRHLANVEQHNEVTTHVQAMEALMADAATSAHDQIHIGFALGKAYEDVGDCARAMRYLQRANQLKRRSFTYSLDADRHFFDALIASFDAARLAHDGSGIEDQTPIFILGMPRSGTSLVEQILASHPEVVAGGELTYLPRAVDARFAKRAVDTIACLQGLNKSAFKQIGQDYLRLLRGLDRTAQRITDKLPHNFLRIGLIRLALPKARVILCERDPIDNCLSLYKNYFIADHPYAYDQQELGRYYRLYQTLIAHWRAVAGDAIYSLRYEQLIAEPASQTRALLDYCGLAWNEACLAFHQNQRRVSTASSVQVRRPIYSDSVAAWKRYEAYLTELISALRG